MCIKILVLCLFLHAMTTEVPGEEVPLARWEEGALDSDLQVDREESMENLNEIFNGKRPMHRERALEQVKRVASPDELSLQQHLISRSPCSCETQYEIRDLGEGYYPRYLTASRCKPKACQNKFNSCRLLHYMVYILRQRGSSTLISEEHIEDENALPEIPLPESLIRKWQLKPMFIGVACVPTTDSRRN